MPEPRPKSTSRPQTGFQLKQMLRETSKESLQELNEISPPKKIAGTGDEFRITAVRQYQGTMDERLSQPKRIAHRFVGFNEDTASTIDHTPYENMKKVATFNKRSISTAADLTLSQKNFFTQDMIKRSQEKLPFRSLSGIKLGDKFTKVVPKKPLSGAGKQRAQTAQRVRGAYRTIAVTNAEEAIPRSVSNQQFKSNEAASGKRPALNILGR